MMDKIHCDWGCQQSIGKQEKHEILHYDRLGGVDDPEKRAQQSASCMGCRKILEECKYAVIPSRDPVLPAGGTSGF